VPLIGTAPTILDGLAAGFAPAPKRGADPAAVLRVQTPAPEPRLFEQLLVGEPGHRLQVAAQVARNAAPGIVRLQIADHWQRLDDRSLALLGTPQLLLGAKALGVGTEIGIEE